MYWRVKKVAMKWFLLVLRPLCLCLLLASATQVLAQGTQIQGPRNAADVYSGVVYGPIDPSDTLWAISSQYRQDKPFTVYQVMLAIYELNPTAFSNRNFNTMINGSTLQLPSDRYIGRIDPQRALQKAQQDDINYQNATGQAGNSIPTVETSQGLTSNLKPDVPLVNKEELDAAEASFQRQISSLKSQQRQVVGQLREQLDSTIQATQSILNENQAVLEKLAKKDEEIVALRTEIADQFNAELAEQAAEIEQLKSFVRLGQAKEELEKKEAVGTLIRDPLFIIIATTVAGLLVFVLIALVLLRKPKESIVAEINSETGEIIDLNDQASQDADDLLSLLDGDDVSDSDLLDDILSDELEDTIDEISPEIEDFDALEDEMLVPDQKEDKKTKANPDEQSDSDVDFDVEALDADSLDGEISLDDDDFSLDSDSDEDEEEKVSDDDSQVEELEDVDIDQVLTDGDIGSTNTAEDGEINAPNEDDVKENLSESAELTESDVKEVGDSSDEEELDEIDIGDLLEQNAQDDGDVPDGINLGRSGEIDEAVIEQIEANINDKNEEINALTETLENDLANNDLEEDIDINDVDELPASDPENVDAKEASIQSIDEIAKDDVEDDIADVLADADALAEADVIADIDDAGDAGDEGGLGDIESDEDDEEEEVDIDAILDDSLDDLINNHIDESDLQSNNDALIDELLEQERDPQTEASKVVEAFDEEEALAEITSLDDIDLSELDDVLDNQSTSEELNSPELKDSPEPENSPEPTTNSDEIDDSILDLPDLDDWLGEDDVEVDDDIDVHEQPDASATSSEDEVLQEIENADFDALLEEMGAISEDDTGSKLAELEADDDDIQIGELTPEDSNDEQVNATQAVESEPQLDNPDLDLTALFDDPDDKQDDGSDFIDVDNLIQESESLTPASDDEVELNIDMSLDSFLSESNGIDVDIDADQASNLDLARVYIDMEDTEAAIEALEQVIKKGNDSQQEEANALIQKLRE